MIIDPYSWRSLEIAELTPIALDTIAVRMKRPKDYVFQAGQYAVVRVAKANGTTLIRQYSFASQPENEILELLIQHEPGGEVSNWFHSEAHVGDMIELSQPFGRFTLDNSSRPVLLIGGRVGVAPLLSIIRSKPYRDMRLLYSVRSKDQICYEDLLSTIDSTIISTDSQPRISADTLAPLLIGKPLIYTCGSKQFVDTISALAYKSGVAVTDLRRELFTLQ